MRSRLRVSFACGVWTAAILLLGITSASGQPAWFDPSEGLVVRVIDAQGEALPGATVQLVEIAGDIETECSAGRSLRVEVAGESGGARFRLANPGRFCLHVQLEGFAAVWVGPFEIDSFAQPKYTMVVPVVVLLPATVVIGHRFVPPRGPGTPRVHRDPFTASGAVAYGCLLETRPS